MSETDALRDLLVDAFTRVADLVAQLSDGLTEEVATYRPDAAANSAAWLLWHLSRVQDDHLAGVTGREQAWPHWRDRFALPFDPDDTGYAQSPAEVAEVRVPAELLAGYHADVHQRTLAYLRSITVEELGRVVDPSWDPPVTVAVRLVSVVGDTFQHLGQTAYVAGLAEQQATRRQAG